MKMTKSQCKKKRVWVSEWVETSCQEAPNPASSGLKFWLTKNKQTEVGEAMQSSSKQNKNMKLWEATEVTSFVTNLSLHSQLQWALLKREIQSLILWPNKHQNWIFLFENIFRCYRDTKPQNPCWTYGCFKFSIISNSKPFPLDLLFSHLPPAI